MLDINKLNAFIKGDINVQKMNEDVNTDELVGKWAIKKDGFVKGTANSEEDAKLTLQGMQPFSAEKALEDGWSIEEIKAKEDVEQIKKDKEAQIAAEAKAAEDVKLAEAKRLKENECQKCKAQMKDGKCAACEAVVKECDCPACHQKVKEETIDKETKECQACTEAKKKAADLGKATPAPTKTAESTLDEAKDCPDCKGKATEEKEKCKSCKGTGKVKKVKEGVSGPEDISKKAADGDTTVVKAMVEMNGEQYQLIANDFSDKNVADNLVKDHPGSIAVEDPENKGKFMVIMKSKEAGSLTPAGQNAFESKEGGKKFKFAEIKSRIDAAAKSKKEKAAELIKKYGELTKSVDIALDNIEEIQRIEDEINSIIGDDPAAELPAEEPAAGGETPAADDTTQDEPAGEEDLPAIDAGIAAATPEDTAAFEKIKLEESIVNEFIKKVGDEYKVVSKKGKNLGGPYKSKGEAEKRLRQVEFFKHKGGK